MLIDLLMLLGDLADIVLYSLFIWRFSFWQPKQAARCED
jgi:hypothetical protein